MHFTVPCIQIQHHRILYLEALPTAIEKRYEDTAGLSQIEVELFVDTSLAWELGELRIVGFVGLYHLWEKYSKEFVTQLVGRRSWRSKYGSTYPTIVAQQLDLLGLRVSVDIREALEEANRVVNCWKHGEKATDILLARHPEYFASSGVASSLHVPLSKLERLFEYTELFWMSLQDQTPIDLSLRHAPYS